MFFIVSCIKSEVPTLLKDSHGAELIKVNCISKKHEEHRNEQFVEVNKLLVFTV